ncbi:MAG: hypothetical protein FE835_04895 [Gammaproteobacteria bacterium]|nr:hypothetical protein [Gammaproteobacteria bacterium]
MPIITWCDEYSVNVEEIDIQHQKMLELVNHLHSAVEACIDKNGSSLLHMGDRVKIRHKSQI